MLPSRGPSHHSLVPIDPHQNFFFEINPNNYREYEWQFIRVIGSENTNQYTESAKLERFLENLDDDKRVLFELQLNSTKIRFNEAQNIMKDVLINGGTLNDAKQAYLDHLSITQNEMGLIVKNLEKTEISSKPSTNSTEN